MAREMQRVIKAIENYLFDNFGIDGTVSDEFNADNELNVIEYSLTNYRDDVDSYFTRYICENYGIKIPVFLMSIYHEIGHIMSADLLTLKKVQDGQIQKEILQIQLDDIREKENRNPYEFYEMYWNIYMEKIANDWAVDYIKNNRTEVLGFWNAIKKDLIKINPNWIK